MRFLNREMRLHYMSSLETVLFQHPNVLAHLVDIQGCKQAKSIVGEKRDDTHSTMFLNRNVVEERCKLLENP